MRLFISIIFNDNFTDALAAMQDDLMRCGIEGNYTRPENLHMTLAFIGEYDDPEEIIEIMRKVPLRSFTIRLTDCKPFKDMFFANIEDNDNLNDYVKRLRRELVDNDIPFDRKKFLPHITLVRKADRTKDIPFGVFEADMEPEKMKVNGISLMKSERGKHGMVYTEIGYVSAF
ncbi:MAG: RNA 2',3'-cyclic phosphodiesterase [Butyrivibrio sp.]|nr:RNA 2',3'-cyclic phosphodiesterase [Butyrivibrio sp.]